MFWPWWKEALFFWKASTVAKGKVIMRRIIAITTVIVFGALHLHAQSDQANSPGRAPAARKLDSKWNAVVGDWVGEGKGSPGSGSGTSSFKFDLQQQVLVRRSHSEYPATAGRPATVHDDLMVIYPGTAEESKAMYFDNEGHVIEYSAKWSAGDDTLTFLSKPTAGAPQFRLAYKKIDSETLMVTFEMAPPGQAGAFKPYVSGRLRRSGKGTP
jgi:hypothetical protein